MNFEDIARRMERDLTEKIGELLDARKETHDLAANYDKLDNEYQLLKEKYNDLYRVHSAMVGTYG
jgi:hypothetical protein